MITLDPAELAGIVCVIGFVAWVAGMITVHLIDCCIERRIR